MSSIDDVKNAAAWPVRLLRDSREPGMVGLLIEAGADPNAHHSSGATPIGIAQQKQKAEIIALVCR